MSKKPELENKLLPVLKHIFSVCWKKCRWHLILVVFTSIVSGYSSAALTPIKQNFFDSVSQAASGNGTMKRTLIFGIIMGLFMVFMLFINGFSGVFSENLTQKLMGQLGIQLNIKASKIEPICYEDSELLDTINKAHNGISAAAGLTDAILSIVTFSLPYFIFMGFYLARIKPLLFLFILFTFIPSLVGQIIRYKAYTNLEKIIAPFRRKTEYYEKFIADREYAKETRVLGAFWFFRKLYETALIIMSKKSWETSRKAALTEIGVRFMQLAGYISSILLLYMYLINGEIGIGAFAAVFSSIDQLFNIMESIMNFQVGSISQNLGMIQNYFKFLKFPERGGVNTDIISSKVELNNVSFTYPNANKESLKNINLTIEEGESLAIVGENGAGKSTLVKLIIGLYLPTKGTVTIGGRDTKEVSAGSVFKNTSAVFQHYQKYKMTIKDNVAISQTNNDVSEDLLKDAIKKSGFDIENKTYADGVNTMLAREYGGIDLSGGQWQKVAIARGLYRCHNMIILDEPTATIDPIEETRLYKKFIDMSKGKTSLIVTHRLGSAKIADRIIVMDNGEIVDCGTHDELMEHEGIYKKMYEAQAKWYVR